MQPGNLTGDYIRFRIDRSRGLMWVEEVSFAQGVNFNGEPTPFSPLMKAMDYMAKRDYNGKGPCRFRIDAHCEGDTATFTIHPTENFHSVVEVPHALLREMLRKILTPRETEAAILLFEGRPIRCIAAQMQVAEGTVKRMNYNIYQKMGLASQVELIRDIYTRLAQYASMRETEGRE